MYKNGILFGRRNVSAWPYYDDGGYIGMGFISASGARVDDFGGGTISGGFMGMIARWFGSEGDGGQGTGDGEGANSFDLQVDDASIFWQGIPLKSGKEAKVTFTQTDKSGAWQKPLSNGVWGEDVLEVMYDVAEQRIQVWKYDPEAGWQKYTKDVPVAFTDGDSFNVRALANGRVVIYRNGNELARPALTIDDQAPRNLSVHYVSYRLSAPVRVPHPPPYELGMRIFRYSFLQNEGYNCFTHSVIDK